MSNINTFNLRIATPDGEFFNGDAERVIARAIDGDVCIMANHSKYFTALSTGIVRVTADGKVRRAACSGGMLSIMDNVTRLVATTFEWEEDIDNERALEAQVAAQKALDAARDSKEIERAKARLSRALVRVYLSSGKK